LHSPDPLCRQKANDLCASYREAPKGPAVLSFDEKMGILAIDRKDAGRAPQSGRARRGAFECIRHGTQARTVAMDVHSGRVIGRCTDRRAQEGLLAFPPQRSRSARHRP